eukprot:m.434011 g.434011  ORF g.434011 m.434011 type:complete len:316 (-) comp17654_c0_seq1:2851-3798(-)
MPQVNFIGNQAFEGCTTLGTISIPAGVPINNQFNNCQCPVASYFAGVTLCECVIGSCAPTAIAQPPSVSPTTLPSASPTVSGGGGTNNAATSDGGGGGGGSTAIILGAAIGATVLLAVVFVAGRRSGNRKTPEVGAASPIPATVHGITETFGVPKTRTLPRPEDDEYNLPVYAVPDELRPPLPPARATGPAAGGGGVSTAVAAPMNTQLDEENYVEAPIPGQIPASPPSPYGQLGAQSSPPAVTTTSDYAQLSPDRTPAAGQAVPPGPDMYLTLASSAAPANSSNYGESRHVITDLPPLPSDDYDTYDSQAHAPN